MVFILHILPNEIQILIYKFINPISKSYITKHDGNMNDWCYICGEFIPEICVRQNINNIFVHRCLHCFNRK